MSKNRKTIPKILKNIVWDTYIGRRKGTGPCYCCRKEIDSKDFECGHVIPVSIGGKNVIENLRPICSCCNKSMGSENLIQFKNTYFEKERNFIVEYYDKIEKLINLIR